MIGERIKKLRKDLKLSQVDFAEKIGVSSRAVQLWEYGESEPRDNTLMIIENAYNVNSSWLRNGEGSIYLASSTNNLADDFIYVPLLSDVKAAAGTGYLVGDETAERELSFRRDWISRNNISADHLSAIHVTGDSMYPTLINGDILLVDHSQIRPQIDRVFVISTSDGLVVKRSGGLNGSKLMLVSDNPAIRDREIDLEKESARVVGRVVWFGRTI